MNKLFFIHVPRTGGKYVQSGVMTNLTSAGHGYVVESRTEMSLNPIFPRNIGFGYHAFVEKSFLEPFLVVATVRNIFDWWVSFFVNWRREWPEEKLLKEFKPWLKTHIIYGNPDEGEIWPGQDRFLFPQLYTDRGNFIVDYICRTETLEDDLEHLSQNSTAVFNKGLPMNLSGKRKDYKFYYDTELIDLVNKYYRTELDLFGYSFENLHHSNSDFYRFIPEDVKNNIKYIYRTNEFTYDK